MKTVSLLTALAICGAASTVTVSAQSQGRDNEFPYDTPFWGLRASFDLSCPGKWKVDNTKLDAFGTGPGVNVGMVYNRPLGGGFYVEPGIGVFYDTMDADYDTNREAPLPGAETIDAWVGTVGLHIPLMAGYRVDLAPASSLFFSTGPQLEIGFTAHLTDDMPGGSSLAGELYDTLLRRFDCQWKVGVGYAFNYNYYVGVEAAFGLVNLAKHSNNSISFHRSLVSFTVGYNF